MLVEHVAVERDVLVAAPFARAVVNHDVAHGVAAEGVLAVGYQRLTATEAHVAHDNVVCVHLERLTGNADTLTGSRLSGNSNIRSAHVDGRLQADDARHVEHHDSCTALLTSPAERAGAVVVEVGHRQHLAAATTKGEHAATFSSGEGRNLSLAQIVGHTSPGHVGSAGLGFFNDNGESYLPCGVCMCLPLLLLIGNQLFGLVGEVGILRAGRQRGQTGNSQ